MTRTRSGAARAAVAGVGVALLLTACSGDPDDGSATSTSNTAASAPTSAPSLSDFPALPAQRAEPLPATVSCAYPSDGRPAAKPVQPPRAEAVPTTDTDVTVATTQGDIGLALRGELSPCTVGSFLSLASQGYFDDTDCHRLTTDPTLSVLQCGDPTATGTGGPGYEFANEFPTDQYAAGDPQAQNPMIYPRGTLAMANAGPGTNGSQFFLVYGDSILPPQYTVFGTIDETGLATLDEIAAAGVDGGGPDGPPAAPTTLTAVRTD
ncbi:peptidylprolyl isomerase [Rhodococcus aetherivorans]|uniref:peptidylprolyl isomerase n=1 Tax=Rhodococcus aetherivorans TaxID=191292 RepID=UPI00241C57CC|nr:peptidylprolyl isomerase [Rhodococcus aetherivorans]MDV6291874.1 peptidylprolyl isomerase [Rhodococcus aetherivorans]WFS14175.1 peptidylprolyl isomerase [Rhodococcus aetherivorans]